jgi:hypothetical protein
VNVDDFRRERDRLLGLQRRLQGARAMPRDLEGEDVSAPHPGDAGHWVAVYEELCRFKRSLIDSIREEGASVDPAARGELAGDDEALSVELERLQLHLDFWREHLPQTR